MHNISPNTLFVGRHYIFLPICHSTNEHADELIQSNASFEGTTILTSNQIKGKGQRGNTWVSEPGKNLTFSVILKPTFLSISNQFYLNIFISLSLLKVLQGRAKGFKVKWPNDLYWYDNKVGGILIENKIKNFSIENCIVGVGLNINQENFININATSLKNIEGKDVELSSIFEQILESIESYYLKLKSGDFNSLHQEYLSNFYWANELHTYRSGTYFKGEIVGIDPSGRLEVLVNGEMRTFDLKEIEFID